jgi:hypothetical protein
MSDSTKTGNTFYTNAMLDNVLVSTEDFCDAAAVGAVTLGAKLHCARGIAFAVS